MAVLPAERLAALVTMVVVIALPVAATSLARQRDAEAPIRSAAEFVILPASDDVENARALVSRLVPGATVTGTVPGPRGRLVIGVLPVPDANALAAAIARLADDTAVMFAAPVYLDRVSGHRMVPTGDMVGRLAAGQSPQRLAALAASHAFVVVAPLPGTTDQFVVRPARPSADVFALARTLRDAGIFQWVEPDFVQQMTPRVHP